MFFNPLQDELDEFGNIDYVCAPPIVPASLLFRLVIISRKTLEITFYLLILIRGPGRFILRFHYDNVMIINVL